MSGEAIFAIGLGVLVGLWVTAWQASVRLRRRRRRFGAAVDKAALGAPVSIDFADDAHAAALELALIDARFSPEALAVVARRAAAAWVEAVDGAVEGLVRGPRIEALRIEALDDGIVPPIMRLLVEIRAMRYREDLDTGVVVDGSPGEPDRWTERWSFALEADANLTWRLVDAEPVSAAAGSGRPRS